jgi:hypothetical protein
MGIVTSPEVASPDMMSPEVMKRKLKGDNFPRFLPGAFCYDVKPRMMNNIVFTKKPNKQKNIENAVIYCIHIPLSQLITADCHLA